MKKLFTMTITLIALLTLLACDTTTTAVTTSVDTTNFHDIYTVEDLMNIEMNKSYSLQADLDLSTIEWTPLGSYDNPYAGIFDGNGYTIQNLTITVKNDFAGLFACISGEVKDLSLTDVSIDYQTDYQTYAGGLSGYICGNIDNVDVTGSITILNSGSDSFVGLLAGMIATKIGDSIYATEFVPNSVSNIHVSGTIDIDTKNLLYAGGLSGYVFNVQIADCYASVTMTLTNDNYRLYAGGLIGYHYGGILYDYADEVDETEIPITGSVASGSIDATGNGTTSYIGGFVGFIQSGVYKNDLAFVDINANSVSIITSAFAGESWIALLWKDLGAGSLTLDPSSDNTPEISSLSGSVVDNATFDDSYYYVTTTETISSPQGSLVSIAELQDPTWYQEWLDWNESVCSFADLAALFS